MRHFVRAIRLSLRYRWSLLLSVVNALLIGVLWGVSITTVYPFVEVVLQGQTVESWLDGQVGRAEQGLLHWEKELTRLEQQRGQLGGDAPSGLDSQIAQAQSRREAEERALRFYGAFKPWVHRWAPTTPFGALLAVIGLLIAATLLKGLCLVANVVFVSRVADRTVMDIRRMFYRKTLEMDQARLEQLGTSSLMTMIAYNTGLIAAGLRTLFGTSVREPLKMAACLVAAALISWRLLAISLVAAPVGILLVHALSRRMKRASLQECSGMADVVHTLSETLNGIKIVRIFNRERRERCRFKNNSRSLYRLGMKMSFFDALTKPVTELTGIVTIALAILVGAYLVLNQETHLFGLRVTDRPLSASTLFVFYAMLAGAADPARKMGDIYNVLVRAAAASQSLFTLFEAPPQIARPARPRRLPRHSESIRLENVTFSYRPMQRVLDRLSVEIPFGETVAVVGQNGCGKSTLLSLLARFYDPQQGGIFLDGVNLRDVSPRQLRRQISLVPQDPMLFRGTIWDNLLYGAPGASEEQVLTAARVAGVADFVGRLPMGYRTPVGDGGAFLSGGQRQRVALARAVLADRPILLLDEATSQIDRQGEALVQGSLGEFLARRTTILVTHRLSTMRLAQRVLSLHRGRLVHDRTSDEFFQCLQQLAEAKKQAA